MLKKEILINYYMKNFEYYGLFLTEESKTKLKAWLKDSRLKDIETIK